MNQLDRFDQHRDALAGTWLITTGVVLVLAGLILWETVVELAVMSVAGMTVIAVGVVRLRDRQLGYRLQNALLLASGTVSVLFLLF